MNSPKFLIFCLAILLSGCGKEAQLKIQSLEAAAQQDKGTIAQLKEQEAKARIDFEVLKTDRVNAEAKIVAQTREAGDAAARAAERIQTLEKERDISLAKEKDYVAKLAAAEVRLSAFEAANAKAAQETSEAANRSTLTVQLGLTMKSGETKPVTNEKVYLMRTKLLTLLPGGYKMDENSNTFVATAAGAWYRGVARPSVFFGRFLPEIVAAIEKDAVAQSTADFNGRLTFEGIVPGDYFVLCATQLGGGATLEKAVSVKGKSMLVALGNSDVLPEFK